MSAFAVTVAVTATAAAPALPAPGLQVGQDDFGFRFVVKNTGTTTVFIGGPGVTATSGYPLAANEVTPMLMADNVLDLPYVVSATTGTVVVFGNGL